MKFARGYIASGPINGNRTPQHIQNQIVREFCLANEFHFLLSRAEYWLNGNESCQLWAAIREEYPVIVFYSLWQLPHENKERIKAITKAIELGKELYFACENEAIKTIDDLTIIEEIFWASKTLELIERQGRDWL